MNNFCTFYIVRHAQSEGNINKAYGADSPLSSTGHLQAQSRAKELGNIHFDKIFSSDLLRAKQTAEIIALEQKLAIETTKVMKERSYGVLEGTNRTTWKKEVKEAFAAWYNKEYEERLKETVVEGMESDEEMIARIFVFLRETAVVYPGKTILIVTHGDLMQTLLVHLGFGRHTEYKYEGISNTGYCILRSDGVDFFVEGTKDIQLTK